MYGGVVPPKPGALEKNLARLPLLFSWAGVHHILIIVGSFAGDFLEGGLRQKNTQKSSSNTGRGLMRRKLAVLAACLPQRGKTSMGALLSCITAQASSMLTPTLGPITQHFGILTHAVI